MSSIFRLESDYEPKGDQPEAIRQLVEGLRKQRKFQTLLGATGTGKTFTIANVVAQYGRPTLLMSHNKTLAAQLYGELKQLFPENAVEYFISYYDYYQPEAYLPTTDTYIEKDASINDDIDRLRLRTTSSLLQREDVIVVASVSAIYALGSPEEYKEFLLFLDQDQEISRDEILSKLVDIQYQRNDIDFSRGHFRVRGDVIEIFPAYEETAIRVEMFGDQIDRIAEIDPLKGETIKKLDRVVVYPAKHFITSVPRLEQAIKGIKIELKQRLEELRSQNKLLEAQRLESRTKYDMEMMLEMGYCSGIENYSRHLSGRMPGERPACLFDYFPDDYLLIIDESHVSVPQINGMYNGDRSRKETLVEHGFRLPSALDNRPLKFHEFENLINSVVFMSATPADYELEKSGGVIVEQIIRPTGLLEPGVEIKPVKGQIDDLLEEIRIRAEKRERILVTTLTKRMAEDLSEYLTDMGVRVRYMHSEIDAIERIQILRDLRLGQFDVLVGINLLREGLDLPEVSLVAILDADKEGFLRSERSLIQTGGRTARNVNGQIIMYADHVTNSMKRAIDEINRRREKQLAYNEEHGITPKSIVKSVDQVMLSTAVADSRRVTMVKERRIDYTAEINKEEFIKMLEAEMKKAAQELNFEEAAILRDQILEVKAELGVKGKKGKRERVGI